MHNWWHQRNEDAGEHYKCFAHRLYDSSQTQMQKPPNWQLQHMLVKYHNWSMENKQRRPIFQAAWYVFTKNRYGIPMHYNYTFSKHTRHYDCISYTCLVSHHHHYAVYSHTGQYYCQSCSENIFSLLQARLCPCWQRQHSVKPYRLRRSVWFMICQARTVRSEIVWLLTRSWSWYTCVL